MNTGVFADTQSWHNPLIQSCTVSAKERTALVIQNRPNQMKDMEKDITLERLFFIYRQGNIDMNYQCMIYAFLTHSNHVP